MSTILLSVGDYMALIFFFSFRTSCLIEFVNTNDSFFRGRFFSVVEKKNTQYTNTRRVQEKKIHRDFIMTRISDKQMMRQ